MNCWHCGTELIWGGDHDLDDYEDMEYDIVTNLSCPKLSLIHISEPTRRRGIAVCVVVV